MKYPEDFINKVILGDCLEVMKEMEDNSVDLIVTDPPYGVNYDGSSSTKREKIKNDFNADLYKKIIPELYRIIKPGGGGIYIFYTNSKSHIIFPLLKKIPYQVFIWYKINFNFNMGAKFKNTYEPILYLKKSPTKFRGSTNQTDVFIYKKNTQNIFHPTQKPNDLIAKLIKLSSDDEDIVFDPFLGSGTTAIIAKLLKRKYIGIEIDPKYYKIAKQRLRQETLF